MAHALDHMLQRMLPGRACALGSAAHVALCVDGHELPVVVRGVGQRLLHVGHPIAPARTFERGTLLVLRIVSDDGRLRIDLPVELMMSGRASMVLRVLASPLVLRRRMVRDQALAEAVGAPSRRPLVA